MCALTLATWALSALTLQEIMTQATEFRFWLRQFSSSNRHENDEWF